MVEEQYYDPRSIFQTLDDSSGMVGVNNIDLAKSFFHARYNDDGKHCSAERATEFYRNAGAAQLYKKGGIEIYPKTKDKEYNFISYGNKDGFKEYTRRYENNKKSSYGHSERFLIWKILDDLLLDDPNEDVTPPSEISNSNDVRQKEYEVLKHLTENPGPYKKYMEEKGVIVKMWSERPACKEAVGVGCFCSSFIKDIFPIGSQFGFIVENYTKADNVNPKKIIEASTDLKEAYLNLQKKLEKKPLKGDSYPSTTVSEPKRSRTE